jgi:hypothetical protein
MVAQLAGMFKDVSNASHARRAGYAEASTSASSSMSTSSSSTTSRQGTEGTSYHALRGQHAQRGTCAEDALLEAVHDALQAGSAFESATSHQAAPHQPAHTSSGSLFTGGSGGVSSLQGPLTVKALTDGFQALWSSLSAARNQASALLTGGVLPPLAVQARASAEAAHALLFQPPGSSPTGGKQGTGFSLCMRQPELEAAINGLDNLNNQLQVSSHIHTEHGAHAIMSMQWFA